MKRYQVIAPIKLGGERHASGVVALEDATAQPLLRDGYLAELDEQPVSAKLQGPEPAAEVPPAKAVRKGK